jgi:hypothetical protein
VKPKTLAERFCGTIEELVEKVFRCLLKFPKPSLSG